MRSYPTTDPVDAVVIGTGAGGAPILARLAKAGLSVVGLEAGAKFQPADHSQDEVAQRAIYWMDERLSGGRDPTAFGGNNSGCGVGGSTLHFGAYAPRPDPRDFKMQQEFGVGEDWPFQHAELVPYLKEAEEFLGVSGPNPYPWDPDRHYTLPSLSPNGPAQLMDRGCRAIGLRSSPAPLLTVSTPFTHPDFNERPACIQCGFCHQGCPTTAKSSMDVTYLPSAVKYGAEIRPNCFAHQMERDASGKITAVVYREKEKDVRQRCRSVFLCAGAIETPRLLLQTGLANSSGQVGKNFMVHVATQIWGSFTEEVRAFKGFPASWITEEMMRPTDADFAGGYLVQSLGIVPVTWAMQVARSRGLWGAPLVNYLRTYSHVAGIGINGECLPRPQNFVALSDEKDARGFPKPLVHLSLGDNEKKLRDHAEALMRKIWTAAGASDLWTVDRTAHIIGTCRLGSDAGRAVVNAEGRSFDVNNLWICDNSVFPSSLAANPTLTIVSLALRTADYFLKGDRN